MPSVRALVLSAGGQPRKSVEAGGARAVCFPLTAKPPAIVFAEPDADVLSHSSTVKGESPRTTDARAHTRAHTNTRIRTPATSFVYSSDAHRGMDHTTRTCPRCRKGEAGPLRPGRPA